VLDGAKIDGAPQEPTKVAGSRKRICPVSD
jgi:hypothetical protein